MARKSEFHKITANILVWIRIFMLKLKKHDNLQGFFSSILAGFLLEHAQWLAFALAFCVLAANADNTEEIMTKLSSDNRGDAVTETSLPDIGLLDCFVDVID
jgi:hypothetical protein